MSIWQKAYETYENCAHLAGEEIEGKQALTPVGHIVQKAQIEITLNKNGKFSSAAAVDKNDCKTILPATEESAGRTGSVRPHPLCDSLQYLAPPDNEKYTAYVEQLHGWAESAYGVPKLNAILSYVESGTILTDLQREGILPPEALSKNDKKYPKYMVRWRVNGLDDAEPACWRDKELFSSYQAYQQHLAESKSQALCMISGESDTPAQSHPKGIVSASYGAKLISANDSSGFTYRGRFTESEQALTVGYTASQKAHNALQWLAANQGVIRGGRTFVCWNPKGKPVYHPIIPLPLEVDTPSIKPSDYKRALKQTLNGYRNELPDNEDIVIAVFDAATTGRLSLTYYSEMKASDFHSRIETWYGTCCMPNGKYGIQSPSLGQIVKCAFGTDRGYIDLDDRVLREQLQRMLACMTEGAKVPTDVVRALCRRASLPLQYGQSNREQVLFTACAVLRKYLNDRKEKEEWTMELDPKNTDRSYLFGRLLAVMEYTERSTYQSGEGREPNAIRMQTVFCERPLHTANILNQKLQPYFERLQPGKRNYCKNLIGDILAQLQAQDSPELNRPLKETYLLGYYLQRKSLYTKKKENGGNENE